MLRALGCSGWSLSLDRATCPGQLRCLGQNVLQKIDLLEETFTCPGQLRCLGQIFSESRHFLKKSPVWVSCAAWDIFLQKTFVFEEVTCLGQLRCLGQNLFQEIDFYC